MDAKKFLQEYRRAKIRITRLEKAISDLSEQSTNVAPVMEGDRVQTSPQPDRIGQVVARVSDLKAELMDARAEALEIMCSVYEVINQVSEPDYQLILHLRYIRCKRWKEIAVEMHYEQRSIYYIHRRAVAAVEKILN